MYPSLERFLAPLCDFPTLKVFFFPTDYTDPTYFFFNVFLKFVRTIPVFNFLHD
ncbi:hypothetical protein C8D70_111110 [Chryseobacterium sp. CBTAP 102]|nr:hypothetical protein C8D70_111110 [Chryseobacterium sp. CBTAP 102]